MCPSPSELTLANNQGHDARVASDQNTQAPFKQILSQYSTECCPSPEIKSLKNVSPQLFNAYKIKSKIDLQSFKIRTRTPSRLKPI